MSSASNLSVYSVEDCLEIMMGISHIIVIPAFEVQYKDRHILSSIATQTFKGLALTDRQLAVLKKIFVDNYAKQFADRNIDLPQSLNRLRNPLRTIDRRTFIKVMPVKDIPNINLVLNQANFKDEIKAIVIRFPFNVQYAKLINEIKKRFEYEDKYYNYDNHYVFPYEEKYVYHILHKFKDKIEDIDHELLENFKKLIHISNNMQNYVPGVYNNEIRNVPDIYKEFITEKYGSPNQENLLMYLDRREALALEHFDAPAREDCLKKYGILTQKIVNRKSFIVNISREIWNLDQVVHSLIDLKRFPLLVIINEKSAADNLTETYTRFRNLFDSSKISVLFRLPNSGEKNIEFNQQISKFGINNSVDENTKIVYINNKRVPKPLLKSNWRPECVLTLKSEKEHNQVQSYYQLSDLVIQYDTIESPWNMWHYDVEYIK